MRGRAGHPLILVLALIASSSAWSIPCAGIRAATEQASHSREIGDVTDATLNGHPVNVDGNGLLLSWVTPQDQAYSQVLALAWGYLENLPATSCDVGTLPTYYCHASPRGRLRTTRPACTRR